MKRLRLWLTLVTALSTATVATALDEITLIDRSIQKGTVIATSPTAVTLEVSGKRVSLPVNEIVAISYEREPIALRAARGAAGARRYDVALRRLATITPRAVSRDLIAQDVAYLKAYAAAKLATNGEGDKNEAMATLQSFVAQYKNSSHQFAAIETLGDLAAANRQYDASAGYYNALARAPWLSYRLHAAVLEARSLHAQHKCDEAIRKYDSVIAAEKRNIPGVEEQRALAVIGKMACLVASNGYPGKAMVPIAELHVASYTWTYHDGCCWEFTLAQHWGIPGNIMYVEAQITTPGVTLTNPSGPAGAQAPIVMSPTSVKWHMPPPDGLWNAPQIVTVCFNSSVPPGGGGVTLTFTGYDGAGNTYLPLQQTSETVAQWGECDKLPDLWMKDTMAPDLPEDFAFEPNTVSQWMWISRDIWVRTSPATAGPSSNPGPDTALPADAAYSAEHQHQSPVHIDMSTPSFVYVKVRNRGNEWSGGGVLRVYWADASAGLNWPGTNLWNEIDCDSTTSAIDPCALQSIAPLNDYVVELPWIPPNPQLFGGNRHFCLIARIETVPWGTFGMTFPEGSGLWQNVADNNNIAWKNLTVLSPQLNTAGTGNVIVRNPLDHAVPLTLQFAVPARERRDHFLRYGDIVIDLGEVLMQKWRETGKRPAGFEVVGKTTIRITDPTNAQLSGLRFRTGEQHTIEVRMQLRRGVRLPAGTTFTWDLIELAPLTTDARPTAIGGERYTFTVPKSRQTQAAPE